MYEPQTYGMDIVEPAVVLGIPTEQSELYKPTLEDEPRLDNDNFGGTKPETYQMGVRESVTHIVVQTVLEILKKAGGG